MGFTREYVAPEAMAYRSDNPKGKTATLSSAMDIYSLGLIALQVLFVQEFPRTDFQVRGRARVFSYCAVR